MKKIVGVISIVFIILTALLYGGAQGSDGGEEENIHYGPRVAVEFIDGETFLITIDFPRDRLEFDTVNDFDIIRLGSAGCRMEGEPGHPLLPRYYCRVLIPPEAAFNGLIVKNVTGAQLDGEYRIIPGQYPARGDRTLPVPFTPPDAGVYSSSGTFPRRPVEYISSGISRGCKYLNFRIAPVRYRPAEGQAIFNSSISFLVDCSKTEERSLRYRSASPLFRKMIARKVVNPGDLDSFYPPPPPPPPPPATVEYLIITDSTLEADFQDFADWKIASGTSAEVVLTDDIYVDYSGSDQQEQIKNCIIDYVTNRGTIWVLLGGDDSIVPDRDCYAYTDSVDGPIENYTIPTDLYYSGLDDLEWNDDGDSLPCEVSDDSVDMDFDVIVGRAPVRSSSGADAFISKVMAYTDGEPPADFDNEMLMLGIHYYNTWDGRSDSERWNDTIFDNHIDPYWTGTGDRFYDTDTDFGGASYDVTDEHFLDLINTGYNMLLVSTHGWYDSFSMETGVFDNSDVALCTNTDSQGIIYSCSCWTNAFEDATYEPCLSEAFLRHEGGGAVAYIGSSRYSWVMALYQTDNLYMSFSYAGEFFQLLHGAELTGYQYTLGSAFAEHKLAFTGSSSSYGTYRWLMFSLNLMGDPQMTVRGVEELVPDTDIVLDSYRWDDSAGGDGDTLAERGEEIVLTAVLANDGAAVEDVEAELTTAEPEVYISTADATVDIGFIDSEEVEFVFEISDGPHPLDHDREFTLTVTYEGAGGTETWSEILTIYSLRGEFFVDGSATGSAELGTETDPFLTIQEAIDAADRPASVYVAEGTYYENPVLAEKIYLYGGYEGSGWSRDIDAFPTVIDGSDAGSVFTLDHLGESDNLISGFSIRGGSASRGGGIFSDDSQVEISDCSIGSNIASSTGGGIYINDGSAIIRDNSLIFNQADYGGGIRCEDCPVEITNNIIASNLVTWKGGGIYFTGVEGEVSGNCLAWNDADNNGGGIYCTDSELDLDANAILLNDADRGGGIYIDECDPTLTNNIMADNIAFTDGGGLFFNSFSGTLMNNTIAGNEADGDGGGFSCHDSTVTVKNTIIWDNQAGGTGDQIDDSDAGSSITVRYSDVEGGYGLSSTVINQDPEFVAPAFGSWDYHIESTSPCKDAGTSFGAPDYDYDGEGRPAGSGIDIGADEWRLTFSKKIFLGGKIYRDLSPAEIAVGEIERLREIDPAVTMTDRARFYLENGGPVIDYPVPDRINGYQY